MAGKTFGTRGPGAVKPGMKKPTSNTKPTAPKPAGGTGVKPVPALTPAKNPALNKPNITPITKPPISSGVVNLAKARKIASKGFSTPNPKMKK